MTQTRWWHIDLNITIVFYILFWYILIYEYPTSFEILKHLYKK